MVNKTLTQLDLNHNKCDFFDVRNSICGALQVVCRRLGDARRRHQQNGCAQKHGNTETGLESHVMFRAASTSGLRVLKLGNNRTGADIHVCSVACRDLAAD